MSVSEAERHQLFTSIEEVLGPDRAATLMSLLPPVGWADVATKHDLLQLEARIDARFSSVDARFTSVDARLDAVDARLDRLDRRLEDTQQSFVTWLLASQAAVLTVVIGAAAAIVALV